jgi:hypothetical protein
VAADAVTVTVMVSVAASRPSLAVSNSTYVPAAENVAVVLATAGCANVTVPGPLTLLHSVVRAPPGRPSSETVPASEAWLASVIVRSAPALTMGARLVMPPSTWTVAESLPASSPSVAVSVSTYVPPAEKVAVVVKALGVPNVTLPGPLVLVHTVDTAVLLRPSSVKDPESSAVAGSVMDWSAPAATTGAALIAPVNGAPETPTHVHAEPNSVPVTF